MSSALFFPTPPHQLVLVNLNLDPQLAARACVETAWAMLVPIEVPDGEAILVGDHLPKVSLRHLVGPVLLGHHVLLEAPVPEAPQSHHAVGVGRGLLLCEEAGVVELLAKLATGAAARWTATLALALLEELLLVLQAERLDLDALVGGAIRHRVVPHQAVLRALVMAAMPWYV